MIKNYICNSLTEGADSLKNVETTYLKLAAVNDRAFVALNGKFYYFMFVNESYAEELVERPYIVRPSYFATAGVWIEQIADMPIGG